MKRTFETLPASSGAKKQKSIENAEKKSPESDEAQPEPVILSEIVNIKSEGAQSIDDHRLHSKPELNLESIVKEEFIIQEIAQNHNGEKKINVMFPDQIPQASCIMNGIQDETTSKDILPENQMVVCPEFVKSESGDEPELAQIQYEIPEFLAEESSRRLTKDDHTVKKIICGECSYYKPTNVPINCPLCPGIINSSDVFIRHVFHHHRLHVCLACNLSFDISTFQNHLRQIHETCPLLECGACDFLASDRIDWSFHLQSHLEKALEKMRRVSLPQVERISCPFCMNSYQRASYLSHLKREHRFFECIACDFHAASPTHLKYHLNEEHRNGDTFDCHKCRFSASTLAMWNHHFISGEHARGATKMGDFSCTKCYHNASNVSQAYFHLQNVHSIFCCIFCDEFETNNKAMLKSHVHEKHKVPHKQKYLKCSICPFRGEKPGISHVEHFKDQHKEATKTLLNSIFALGFALQISRKFQSIENDSVKQEIGEEGPSSEDVLINEDDIKIELDFCEIQNE